jgi:tetratricopeptide (TPR) repeat protein
VSRIARALPPARVLVVVAALAAPARLLASGGAVTRPADADARAALGLVYDGDFPGAEARLAALAQERPGDPVLPYLQALALEWRLEQDPASRGHDAEVLALADRSLGLAGAVLARDPADGRALLARGAAHGVKSRLHLFRWDKSPAAREAVRMREALAAARAAGAEALDLDFGLGLYDYYADTLPRFFKLVAFVLRIPGGDRERGLESLARVARGGSLFHDDEARVQMYDVHSYFERKPDRALHWIREMWRLHPGWPIWGLKLSQLLSEPMGLWAESAAVARGILATAEEGRHPNYQPVVAAMARVRLAEALLGDLRFEEACATARAVPGGVPGASWIGERVQRVLARCHGLEQRAGSPEVVALALLARSRRLRERGDVSSAEAACLEAFRAFPASAEARVCAARESLRAGRPESALELARAALDGDGDPGLRPSALLALARALEDQGNRKDALPHYRRAWDEPLGRDTLRTEAAAAIRRLDPGVLLPDTPPLER